MHGGLQIFFALLVLILYVYVVLFVIPFVVSGKVSHNVNKKGKYYLSKNSFPRCLIPSPSSSSVI